MRRPVAGNFTTGFQPREVNDFLKFFSVVLMAQTLRHGKTVKNSFIFPSYLTVFRVLEVGVEELKNRVRDSSLKIKCLNDRFFTIHGQIVRNFF